MYLIWISLLGLALFAYFCWNQKKPLPDLKGKHVLITGGSSGIGLKLAHEVLKLGANITLYARNKKKLQDAKDYLLKMVDLSLHTDDVIQIQSVNMNSSRAVFSKELSLSEDKYGPVFLLINCAGFAKPGLFENLEETDIKEMFEANVYGSFFLTQEVVKRMKNGEIKGFIIFVSSMSGLFGFFGFTAYSACKAAVIKMAEALHMELKPYEISVTVGLPPDTDTPGFHEEQKSKPVECKLISGSAELTQPDVIAKALLKDAFQNKFFSTVGMEGFMLRVLCGGMAPRNSIIDFVCQICLVGLFKLISGFYLFQFNNIVKNEHLKKIEARKRE